MARAKASRQPLSDGDLLLLGLVAERPRHGYELDREIERRGLREWTPIAFSSVYFVLAKLERAGLLRAARPTSARARKTFTLTARGRRALTERTLAALSEPRTTYPSLLLGMLHWPVVEHAQGLAALETRARAVASELRRLTRIQSEQQPLPDFVDALFDFSIGQLRAEADWIARTTGYLRTRPRLE
jgi:DNA-binding PadR family transcriptional regulator